MSTISRLVLLAVGLLLLALAIQWLHGLMAVLCTAAGGAALAAAAWPRRSTSSSPPLPTHD